MNGETKTALVAATAFALGLWMFTNTEDPKVREAIAECEQNLPRSQKCYAVIVAEPEGVE